MIFSVSCLTKLRTQLFIKLNALKVKQSELQTWFSYTINPVKFALGIAKPDIIITHCEVNNRQGVGILIQRIFPDDRNILSLRSRNLYNGRQRFGCSHQCLNHTGKSGQEILMSVAKILRVGKPRQVLVAPYFIDDVQTALAIKKLFNIPLCTYLMDDQNVYADNIPDHLMHELLTKSELCLGISYELCQAYEKKYKQKFWFLPPVVDRNLIQTKPEQQFPDKRDTPSGVLIGNIWSQQWLDKFRQLTRETDHTVEWYGNPNRRWLNFRKSDLKKDGIDFKGYYPEGQLVGALRHASYAIILTSSSQDIEDRPELAKLSLPSRLTYLVAVANVPIIVVGDHNTAAAKFIDTFQLGIICDYTSASFHQAVLTISSPSIQAEIRQRAAQLAPSLSAENIDTWIWRSLAKGKPINYKFEQFGKSLKDASVVITAFEVNQHHGTGPLVKRIIGNTPQILSIHSMDMYSGEHDFGELSLLLSHGGFSRQEARQNLINQLRGNTIKQIFCVPYRPDDLITAISLVESYQVPLGGYIMDDQNICTNQISDALMAEFLNQCSLRLATHPELREAYETKYGLDFWLLPAVVPNTLISTIPEALDIQDNRLGSGILIGSIWSKQWFNLLCEAVKEAKITIDWYGNNRYPWMTTELANAWTWGIKPCGLVLETVLVDRLRRAAYAIVPTGTLDYRDNQKELSQLSLPGRIIFTLATANTPIIVIGNSSTPAAQFVKKFGVGVTCDYNGESLKSAIHYVTEPQVQVQMRNKAAKIAASFSDYNINRWLWNSIERGEPDDLRFEELFNAPAKSAKESSKGVTPK